MSECKVVVMGATSGIGREVALLYIARGYRVGVAGRRSELLEELRRMAPERVECATIDITREGAEQQLLTLVERLGGMDLYFHVSGTGQQNSDVDTDVELGVLEVNALGFTRMVTTAFNYFVENGRKGRIAVVSSIASTRGLGVSPSYSASKAYKEIYVQSLSQLAHIKKADIGFTVIRPGFVRTAFLKHGNYPMLMKPEKVARTAVRAVDRGRREMVIDWRYAVLVFFWRLIPRCVWERLNVHN
ncbi:MAG: SDR family NAD(P)-dependent oxidoreductase [Tidjanibacter sp.]|nr:SDR family NAD(P)-dependent oxidoreductase [Tidjanibacter sp.]